MIDSSPSDEYELRESQCRSTDLSGKKQRKRGKKTKKRYSVYTTSSGREVRLPKKLCQSSSSDEFENVLSSTSTDESATAATSFDESAESLSINMNTRISQMNKSLNTPVTTTKEDIAEPESGNFEDILEENWEINLNDNSMSAKTDHDTKLPCDDDNSITEVESFLQSEVDDDNSITEVESFLQSEVDEEVAAPGRCKITSNVPVHLPLPLGNYKAPIGTQNVLGTPKMPPSSSFVPKKPSNYSHKIPIDTSSTPLLFDTAEQVNREKNNNEKFTDSNQNDVVTREEVQAMLAELQENIKKTFRAELANAVKTFKDLRDNDLTDSDTSDKLDGLFPLKTNRDFENFETDTDQQAALKKYLISMGGDKTLIKCSTKFLRAAVNPKLLFTNFTWNGDCTCAPFFETKAARIIATALVKVKLLKKGDVEGLESCMRQAFATVKQNVRDNQKKEDKKGNRVAYKEKMLAMYG